MSELFEEIYAIDLIYKPDCWRLCGDGHCCHFARYRHPRLPPAHTLLLLPGEMDFLETKGYTTQFASYERVLKEFQVDRWTVTLDSLVISLEEPRCACQHDIRPTICRLYPFFPILESDGRLASVDIGFTLDDLLEDALGAPRVCQVQDMTVQELKKFLKLITTLSSDPNILFHLLVFRDLRELVAKELSGTYAGSKRLNSEDFPRELLKLKNNLLSGKLIDGELLQSRVREIGSQIEEKFGREFQRPNSVVKPARTIRRVSRVPRQ